MADVYVVTSGSYDSFGIDAIFSTPEKAQAFVDAKLCFMPKDSHINAWTIDDPEHDDAIGLTGKNFFYVTMKRNGNEAKAKRAPWSSGLPNFVERKDEITGHCFATDEKHAIKILNERRMQWLAELMHPVKKDQ